MEIPDRLGALRPKLFRKTTRDALADLMAQRYPAGRRKAVLRAFRSLTDDEARAVCSGTPSQATLEKVLDEGGWGLALELLALRFGEGVDQHLERERRRHADQASRLAAMAGDIRSLVSARRDLAAELDPPRDRRGRLVDRRVGAGADQATDD